MKKFYTAIACAFFFSSALLSEENEIPVPKAMAALGDSLSEGMLSDFSIEDHPTRWQVLHLIYLAGAKHKGEFTDRISIFRKFYAAPQHSWSTGDDESDFVNSHYERLKERNPHLRAFNFAVSGDYASQLDKQVERLFATEKKEKLQFDYITLMIGANDLRAEKIEEMTKPAEFAESVEANLRKLLVANPDRRILVLGLPPIHKVFEHAAPLIGYRIPFFKWTCAELRDAIYGPLVLFHPENKDEYEESKVIMKAYENEIDRVVQKLSEEFTQASIKAVQRYDEFFSVKKSLSIDCFHASFWGQAQLSEIAWLNGFWPKD